MDQKAGGVFVDRAAEAMLRAKLQGSRYQNGEFMDLMIQEFEKKVCTYIFVIEEELIRVLIYISLILRFHLLLRAFPSRLGVLDSIISHRPNEFSTVHRHRTSCNSVEIMTMIEPMESSEADWL
jgi:hypothetical protein